MPASRCDNTGKRDLGGYSSLEAYCTPYYNIQ